MSAFDDLPAMADEMRNLRHTLNREAEDWKRRNMQSKRDTFEAAIYKAVKDGNMKSKVARQIGNSSRNYIYDIIAKYDLIQDSAAAYQPKAPWRLIPYEGREERWEYAKESPVYERTEDGLQGYFVQRGARSWIWGDGPKELLRLDGDDNDQNGRQHPLYRQHLADHTAKLCRCPSAPRP